MKQGFWNNYLRIMLLSISGIAFLTILILASWQMIRIWIPFPIGFIFLVILIWNLKEEKE